MIDGRKKQKKKTRPSSSKCCFAGEKKIGLPRKRKEIFEKGGKGTQGVSTKCSDYKKQQEKDTRQKNPGIKDEKVT